MHSSFMQYVANSQVGGTVFTCIVFPNYNPASVYNFTIKMTMYYVYVVSLICFVNIICSVVK